MMGKGLTDKLFCMRTDLVMLSNQMLHYILLSTVDCYMSFRTIYSFVHYSGTLSACRSSQDVTYRTSAALF